MKWIQTYSGQLINLESMDVITKSGDGNAVIAFTASTMHIIAEEADVADDPNNSLDEVMARIIRFILEVRRGYRNSFYSFPESDIAREKAEQKYHSSDGGRPLPPSTLPEFSLRLVKDDPDTPYHLYAGDELVEKFAGIETDGDSYIEG